MAEKAKPETKEKIPHLFKDSFFIADKGAGRRSIAFFLSLIIYAVIICAMIVLPLLDCSSPAQHS